MNAETRTRIRQRTALFSILLAWALAASALSAQTPVTEHVVAAEAGALSPPATLADAAWLEGHWVGTGLGADAEEVWLGPAGGAMAGMFRLLSQGEVQFYEIWALVEEEGSLVLRLKHFDRGMVAWEEREEMVVFPLVALDEKTLWFDGLTMKRDGPDALTVWVAMERADGTVTEGEFVYRRKKVPGPYPSR